MVVMGQAMRGLEKGTPPVSTASKALASVLEYLSPETQAFAPTSPARPGLPDRLIISLQVTAALLCLLVLGEIFKSEGLAAYRDGIAILLTGSATAMTLSAAQLVRRNHEREKLARESVEHIIQAAQTARIGLWGWKPDTDRFWGTPVCLDALGLPHGTTTLEDAVRRLHPEDRSKFCNLVRDTARTKIDRMLDCRLPRENGTGWLRFSLSGFAESEGDQVSGSVMDITGQHETEAEVANLRRSLTHLTRVGLLGQLGGALAHELKQPLTAILSNAQALQRLIEHEKMDMTEIRAVIGDIIQDDSRAASVIQHLRSLLKPGEFHSQLLDMNEIVRGTLELVHNEMITRKVAVSTAVHEGRLQVMGDPIQLQQLLLNLIFNAADAMASGKGGMILITTDLIEGPAAHLAVTDTGTGIEPDVMDRLFEPFVSTKAQGVGLGLSISRAIVLSHKGRIWAQNNPGRGATFHVSLPLVGDTP
jgi:C4-dicarboxylate-specific signal transduction histidine kinase